MGVWDIRTVPPVHPEFPSSKSRDVYPRRCGWGFEGPGASPTTRLPESVAVGIVPGTPLVGLRPVSVGLLTPTVEETSVLSPETVVVTP